MSERKGKRDGGAKKGGRDGRKERKGKTMETM